jgi:hypothetical protein
MNLALLIQQVEEIIILIMGFMNLAGGILGILLDRLISPQFNQMKMGLRMDLLLVIIVLRHSILE